MPSENIPFRGRRTCECVVRIVPLVEAEMKRRGLIKNSVDFFQMGYNKGGVSASAGTHDRGGCIDVAQHSDAHLAVWRMFGVRMQRRTPAQGFSLHGHGWPGGCPHLSSGARYQESEWRARRNGLRGRGPVTGPGYTTITWQQAVSRYGKKKPPAPAGKKPPAPAAKDAIDMAKWFHFQTGKVQGINNKTWTYIKINDKGDVSFGTGPGKIISGTLGLSFTGLPTGQWVSVRIVEDDVDGKNTRRVANWPINQILAAPSATHRSVPFTMQPGKAPKGQRRLRAIAISSCPGVRLAHAEVAYWKA